MHAGGGIGGFRPPLIPPAPWETETRQHRSLVGGDLLRRGKRRYIVTVLRRRGVSVGSGGFGVGEVDMSSEIGRAHV